MRASGTGETPPPAAIGARARKMGQARHVQVRARATEVAARTRTRALRAGGGGDARIAAHGREAGQRGACAGGRAWFEREAFAGGEAAMLRAAQRTHWAACRAIRATPPARAIRPHLSDCDCDRPHRSAAQGRDHVGRGRSCARRTAARVSWNASCICRSRTGRPQRATGGRARVLIARPRRTAAHPARRLLGWRRRGFREAMRSMQAVTLLGGETHGNGAMLLTWSGAHSTLRLATRGQCGRGKQTHFFRAHFFRHNNSVVGIWWKRATPALYRLLHGSASMSWMRSALMLESVCFSDM